MPYRDDLRALEERRDALEAELADVRHQIRARRLPVLAAPRIASPCDVPWSSMKGDDRVRLCAQCAKYVYNLSAMTHAQATDLLAREPRLCVRYYERADGTILTSDCALGARKRRIRRVKAMAPAALVVSSLAALAAGIETAARPVTLLTVEDAVRTKAHGQLRVEGRLVHGSIEKTSGGMRFVLATNDVQLPVQYSHSIVPDTFRDRPDEEVSAVVEGLMGDDGVFYGDQMYAKGPNQGYRIRQE
jgi:cytochrome c-type biogenesis protein CcmE